MVGVILAFFPSLFYLFALCLYAISFLFGESFMFCTLGGYLLLWVLGFVVLFV
jgi:hypothetical protein